MILGNHRDAWTFGAAVDPNSGTAALLEVTMDLKCVASSRACSKSAKAPFDM